MIQPELGHMPIPMLIILQKKNQFLLLDEGKMTPGKQKSKLSTKA